MEGRHCNRAFEWSWKSVSRKRGVVEDLEIMLYVGKTEPSYWSTSEVGAINNPKLNVLVSTEIMSVARTNKDSCAGHQGVEAIKARHRLKRSSPNGED